MKLLSLALAVGITGGGLWLSHGLGTLQVWLFGAGLAGLVGIVAESFLDDSAGGAQGWSRYGFTAWVAGGLLVATGIWLVQMLPQEALAQAASVIAVLTGVLLVTLREGIRSGSRFSQPARFLSNVILYLLVFLLLALIYQTKQRALITSTSSGVVTVLVGLEQLRSGAVGRRIDRRLIALAAMGGLVVGEVSWFLNYWPVSGLVGGAFLLLSFYVVVGLLQCIRDGKLGRNELLEYGAVGALGFVAVLFVVP